MKQVLHSFSTKSGLTINTSKSRILFSTNTPQDRRHSICETLCIDETDELGNYLGLPIHSGRASKRKYQFIIDKVQAKLASWKSNLLSFAGRRTLIQQVAAAIPSYYNQAAPLPKGICEKIDQLQRNFLWGSSDERRKIHLVNWDMVCKPKELGGLGLRKTHHANILAAAGACWRLEQNPQEYLGQSA